MDKMRKTEGDVPSDRIADELAKIDKMARRQLTSDADSLYGIEAYEKERRDLRALAQEKTYRIR